MAFKEYRNMKVYEQSGYHYKATPAIMLKGQWLREVGFDEGTPITVRCEGGRLTITRADDMDADYPEVNDAPVCQVAESKAAYAGRKGCRRVSDRIMSKCIER